MLDDGAEVGYVDALGGGQEPLVAVHAGLVQYFASTGNPPAFGRIDMAWASADWRFSIAVIMIRSPSYPVIVADGPGFGNQALEQPGQLCPLRRG